MKSFYTYLINKKRFIFTGTVLLCAVLLIACPLPPRPNLYWAFRTINLSEADLANDKNQVTCDGKMKMKVTSEELTLYESPLVSESSYHSSSTPRSRELVDNAPIIVEVWCLDNDNQELAYAKYLGNIAQNSTNSIVAFDALNDEGVPMDTGGGDCEIPNEKRGIFMCTTITVFKE